MEKISAARGTQDIIPPNSKIWQSIEDTAARIFAAAGLEEIRTPIFESTSLFSRAVGADTDIVNKEMYTFEDRSQRSLTLRPEATAGVVRAYIEHSLDRTQRPQKFWYRGSMFRYERPQTGRYREFHQIGVECFGSKGPHIDAELINLGLLLLQELGLEDLTLYINSIGNTASRQAYRGALQDFLAKHLDSVCEDCKKRYHSNPLRALDCKVPEDQVLYEKAPKISDYYDAESKQVWQELQDTFNTLNIAYQIDSKLVRGLDYYNHLVFEIKSSSKELGQQSTVLAGGRYDNLVESLGGPSIPAVGWALGMERLSLLLQKSGTEESRGLYIICDTVIEAQMLAIKLRKAFAQSVSVEFDFDSARVPKQLEKALKKGSRWALFYLEDERKKNLFKIKDLLKGSEQSFSDSEALIKYVQS